MVRSYARRRSDACPWDTKQPETYRYGFGVFAFDVRKAKELICASPREIRMVDTSRERVERLIGRPPEPDSFDIGTVYVDWEKAKTADISTPLIVAMARVDPESQKRSPVVIDGHHRLARAWLDKIPELPYVLLTDEESDEVMTETIRLPRRKQRSR